MNRYDNIAWKLVPTGHQRSRESLRTDIADAIRDEVERALRKQQEKEFPDLAKARVDIEAAKSQADSRHKEMDRWHNGLKAAQQKLEKDQARLAKVVQAGAKYIEWTKGGGPVDELDAILKGIHAAWQEYLGDKK